MSACTLCGVNCPPEADAVEAGGDLGRCHSACFQDWDRQAEACEMALFDGMFVPMLVAQLEAPAMRARR